MFPWSSSLPVERIHQWCETSRFFGLCFFCGCMFRFDCVLMQLRLSCNATKPRVGDTLYVYFSGLDLKIYSFWEGISHSRGRVRLCFLPRVPVPELKSIYACFVCTTDKMSWGLLWLQKSTRMVEPMFHSKVWSLGIKSIRPAVWMGGHTDRYRSKSSRCNSRQP